jgi:hypothetical protein
VLADVSANTVEGLSETALLVGPGTTSNNVFGPGSPGEPSGPPVATPEPSSLGLVVLGLVLVATVRHRRRASRG